MTALTATVRRSRHAVRRDLTLLSAGTTASIAGDAAAFVALLLELRHAGVGWVSAMLAAELLPFPLFASLSGRLVDRIDNRRLLVTTLLGQALVALPLAYARSPLLIVLLVFALSAISTTVRPAVSAMVPALSGEERARSAYAWVATGGNIGWIVGPAIGGILTSAFGVGTAILVDAGSFAVLAGACTALSATRGAADIDEANGAGGPDGATERPRGGLAILRRDPILWASIFVTALVVASAVVDNVAAPYRFINQLHTTSTGFGVYLALWGCGALAGAQLPRWIRPSRMPLALTLANALCALAIVGIGIAPSLVVAFAASVCGGVGNGVANVAVSSLVSSRVSETQRGRAFASAGAVIQTATGFGTVVAAPLVAALSAGTAMAIAGAIAAAVALGYALAVKRADSTPDAHR